MFLQELLSNQKIWACFHLFFYNWKLKDLAFFIAYGLNFHFVWCSWQLWPRTWKMNRCTALCSSCLFLGATLWRLSWSSNLGDVWANAILAKPFLSNQFRGKLTHNISCTIVEQPVVLDCAHAVCIRNPWRDLSIPHHATDWHELRGAPQSSLQL